MCKERSISEQLADLLGIKYHKSEETSRDEITLGFEEFEREDDYDPEEDFWNA